MRVRRSRWSVPAAAAIVLAATVTLVGTLHRGSSAASPSSALPSSSAPPPSPPAPHEQPEGVPTGVIGRADGVVPDGVTVLDGSYPAVANLDPRLLGALRRAAADAARRHVTFYVDSGWRSRQYQEQLLRQAIAKYGSEQQAARWVATPGTSAHVSGDAVDLGHADAATWLAKHGGLQQ